MKRSGILALTIGLLVALSFVAHPKAELTATDMGFAGKPFNPKDSGMVQRILLRDQDVNEDDVILTKLTVENLGTATNEEIDWVKVELDIEGKVITLAETDSFPISLVLLSVPLDQRTIPDDTSATLSVYVGIAEQISDGHTIQTQVEIRFSEMEEGEQILVKDAKPEVLSTMQSLSAELLPVEGGILNPGDELPVMQLILSDPPDSNFWGLQITKVKVTGPSQIQWVFGTDTQRCTIKPGQFVTFEEPVLAAFDESQGTVSIWARVPAGASIPDPIIVKPQLEIVVTEGQVERGFSFSDTVGDTIIEGGFEHIKASVNQAGKIIQAPQESLLYSVVTLRDQDRNNSYLRVKNLKLLCLGTICNQLSNIEIEDSQGNLIGYSHGLDLVKLMSASGELIRVADEGAVEFLVSFDVASPVPLGGSLLLAHIFEAEEIVLMGEKTNFSGTQQVVPEQAVFFGRPTISLSADEDSVVISTDGETIKTLTITINYGPDPTSVTYEILPRASVRLTSQQINAEEGHLVLGFQTINPAPGEIASVSFKLAEEVTSTVEVQISLDVDKVVDTAGIELPYALTRNSAVLSLEPPLPEEAPAVTEEEQPVETQVETAKTTEPSFVGLTLASSYRQGDIIRTSFGMIDENGQPILNDSVSISIVKTHEGQASEVVYVGVVSYNPSTEKYELEYNTSKTNPGIYDIYISSSRGPSQKFSIEIRS